MEYSTVKGLFSLLVLPPAGPLLLALLGALLVLRRRPGRGARLTLWVGVLGAWLFATPAVAEALIGWLERASPEALTARELAAELGGARPPGAIVVLAGGVRHNAREWPEVEWTSPRTLERLAFAALLARSSKLPVLVSGGTPNARKSSEAELMARALSERFGLQARWIEDRSTDTDTNATESARVLAGAGVKRVVLVTQAYHMPRALAAFRRAGLDPVAAPHGFLGGSGIDSWKDFVPGAGATVTAWLATHELAGLLWDKVRTAR